MKLHNDQYIAACAEQLGRELTKDELIRAIDLLADEVLQTVKTANVAPDANDLLSAIGARLRTQDNRSTADPAFCVQVLERIGPIMDGYGSDEICFHNHEECETYYYDGFDLERWEELKKLHDDGELPDEYTASSYVEKWITVQTCFTEEGCNRYLELDGHNLRQYHGVRIYAQSFHRNVEMLEIRNFLMGNTTAKTPPLPASTC